MSDSRDDSLMNRFEDEHAARYRASDAVVVVLLVALLLGLFAGGSVLRSGERSTGVQGRIVSAVGRPFATISRRLGLAGVTRDATGFLSPDANLGSAGGGFAGETQTAQPAQAGQTAPAGQIPAVTAEAFEPSALGAPAPPRRPLHTLLVTGDSMVMPLDADLAQQLVGKGVRVIQDPHVGTGISNSQIVDWGKLAAGQVQSDRPDAVVVFVGANEGWPMADAHGSQVQCCGVQWAAIYAQRVRLMANTYRQGGRARVYWVTIPDPREADREAIARVVNAAIAVGVQPWVNDIRVQDTVPIFTPTGYRDDRARTGWRSPQQRGFPPAGGLPPQRPRTRLHLLTKCHPRRASDPQAPLPVASLDFAPAVRTQAARDCGAGLRDGSDAGCGDRGRRLIQQSSTGKRAVRRLASHPRSPKRHPRRPNRHPQRHSWSRRGAHTRCLDGANGLRAARRDGRGGGVGEHRGDPAGAARR
jgi:hypothetical protein